MRLEASRRYARFQIGDSSILSGNMLSERCYMRGKCGILAQSYREPVMRRKSSGLIADAGAS